MGQLFTILIYIAVLFAIVIGISLVISVVTTFIGIWMVDRASKKNGRIVLPMLPGTDCKECGCETCAHYAQCIADERKELGKCPHLSEEAASDINGLFPRAEPYRYGALRKPGGGGLFGRRK